MDEYKTMNKNYLKFARFSICVINNSLNKYIFTFLNEIKFVKFAYSWANKTLTDLRY